MTENQTNSSTARTGNSLRCLCTSVGNDGFVSVHSALKTFYGEAITIIGCDIRPDAYGLYLADKGHIVPRREEPQFAERLLSIAQQEQCSVIYPLSTFDQEYFAKHRGFFEECGIGVVVGDVHAVTTANDKLKVYDLCRQKGLPVADYVPLDDTSSLTGALRQLGYPRQPVVFKLARGTAARGLAIIREGASIFESIHQSASLPHMSAEELCQTLSHAEWCDGVLCEYLPGDEYSVDVLSWQGQAIISVVRKRYASSGGLALHAEVVNDPEVANLAEAVVQHLGLSYTSNVQFRRSVDGTPCLMEVNPRIPGTIGLTVRAGVNMPALGLELALGRSVSNNFSIEYGMRILRHWGEFYHKGRLLS